jgi:hypothetical protein
MRQASAITVTGGSTAEICATTQAYSSALPSANPATTIATTGLTARIFASLLSDLDDGSTISPGVGYSQLGEHDIGTETVSVEQTQTLLLPAPNWAVHWTAAAAHWGIMAVSIRAVHYRFWGEVSSLPGRWDTSGNDAWVPIEAAGILRRLGQGNDPAETGLRNFIYPAAGLFRYWPLGGASGTQYSLDIAPVWGSPQNYRFLSLGASFKYGEPMGSPYLGTGMALFNTIGGWMRGNVGNGDPYWAFDMVLQSQQLGELEIFFTDFNGTFWTLDLDGTSGAAQVTFTDPPVAIPTTVFPATGVLEELNDQAPHHVRFQLLKNGTATDWALYIDGALVDDGSQASYQVYGMQHFQMQYTRTGTESWVNLAHLAVWAHSSGATTWSSSAPHPTPRSWGRSTTKAPSRSCGTPRPPTAASSPSPATAPACCTGRTAACSTRTRRSPCNSTAVTSLRRSSRSTTTS